MTSRERSQAALSHRTGEAVPVDFGTRNSQFCSPVHFRELWMPYCQRMKKWIHENTAWKTFNHSCGAMAPLIGCIIEAGFDILNPVQCSATGMEARELKREFRDSIVFWGGGVDTQQVLPFGSPQQVREQVLERLDIFSRDGGYVFNAIHNVQARTPTANMIAMLEAVREFNGRGKWKAHGREFVGFGEDRGRALRATR